MTFAIANKLSGSALQDLLSLIDLHCMVPHRLIKSLHTFKQYFKTLKNPLKKHYYCSQCCLSIAAACEKCPNVMCNQEFTDNNKCFFIEIPIFDQLKALFNRKGFYNDLQHRFNRKNAKQLSDIYDGTAYQKLMEPNKFLSFPGNVSFSWNTDGISVFKSSKYSIWPLYFAINELPIHKRWCGDNLLLAGLWFGYQKPNMLTFLKPFVESLSTMHAGVTMCSPDITDSFKCHARLLCGTCDLPAKAMVLNMMQFNGQYGCTHCTQSGKQFSTGERGTVHVYPYIQNNPGGPERNSKNLEKDAREATDTGEPVLGIKGPSWLSMVPEYNILAGNTVDYMHCVLLGVTRMILKLWFDSEHSQQLWYCGNRVKEVDSKLLQIKPPLTITRTPRSIEQHRSYWKASEYRNWLLLYSLPVMFSILPMEYLAHHMLLVEAIHTLLKSSITSSQLNKAEKLLQHYCFKLQHYYSEQYMTANVHHLLHLSETVKKFGPLYVYSCFPFEGANGSLLSYIRGTQHIDAQILETVSIRQSLPYVVDHYLPCGSDASNLYYKMKVKRYEPNKVAIGENYALGKITNCSYLTDPIHQAALEKVTKSKTLGRFSRAIVHGQTVHSLEHTQPKKRNSHTVAYNYDSKQYHGTLLYYVTDFKQIYAVVVPFVSLLSVFPTDDITFCSVPHIHVYNSISQSVHIIPISSVNLSVVMSFEEVPNTIYICEQPNTIERD